MSFDLAAINAARLAFGKRALTEEEVASILADRAIGRTTEDSPEFIVTFLTNIVRPGDPGPKPGSYSAGAFRGNNT